MIIDREQASLSFDLLFMVFRENDEEAMRESYYTAFSF